MIDDFKYQILTLQNQTVANEKYKYFPTNLIFEIKLQLKPYLNLLRQVKCFVTCWVNSSIISSDNDLTQCIMRENWCRNKGDWPRYVCIYIIYIYIYIYIHRHVFHLPQDSPVRLGLTSREQLMLPECSKHQVLSFAKMLVVWWTNRKYSVLISVLQSAQWINSERIYPHISNISTLYESLTTILQIS